MLEILLKLFSCLFLNIALKYTPLGCFNDDGYNRALPKFLKNFRSQINWKNISLTIEACAEVAQQHNVEYFGIQFYGECWAAKPGTAPDYDKYGTASNCWNGVGGSWSNYVYKSLLTINIRR